MKKLTLFTVLFCWMLSLTAQVKEDAILGRWLSESGKAKIEIFKSNGKFYGKIVWLKNPNNENGQPKVDKNNPDPEERKHRILGLLLVRSLEFDGSGEWHNGTIYDPENGKSYKCKITKTESGDLNIRGYIGVSMIGRSTVWTHAD